MMKTDNRQALSSAALRRVDDFTMSITPPKAGVISLCIHLDGCEPLLFVLRAENDDLMKLKAWMEAVVRDERAEVALSGGQRLAYCVTDVPESSVEPTCRFLDELFPSPIGILTLTPAEGEALEGVVKVKHFLNALYLHLLTGGNADGTVRSFGCFFAEEWYVHAPLDRWSRERVHEKLFHYNQLQSNLLEWYVCSSESYAEKRPRFLAEDGVASLSLLWVDWGCCLWMDGVLSEDFKTLELRGVVFDISDIEGFAAWEKEMWLLAEQVDDEQPMSQEIKAWHVRGYRLAQQLREHMPLNAGLIYEMSWDVAYDTPEWKKDVGHVIFNPKLLAR